MSKSFSRRGAGAQRRFSKKALRLCASAVNLFFVLGPFSGPARAASLPPPSNQHLAYEVYAGGVNALASTLTIATGADGTYDIMLSTQTRGLLGHLAPWHGNFESQGRRTQSGTLQTLYYHGATTWRSDTQEDAFTYTPDGRLLTHKLVDKGADKSPPIDHGLSDNTVDALAATLAMLDDVATNGKCQGGRAVFDGLRRYKLVFTDQGPETLKGSQYAGYNGPAERCTAEVVPDGGRWHDKPRGWLNIQEQGRQKGALPTVWVAQLDKNAPAVPVRVKVVTAYGVMFMQLTGYSKK